MCIHIIRGVGGEWESQIYNFDLNTEIDGITCNEKEDHITKHSIPFCPKPPWFYFMAHIVFCIFFIS